MKYFPIILFLFLSISVQAQLERIIHQTFEIEDEVNKVALDLLDSYEIEKWAGNSIMTVAKIELTGGANHILDFFVKEGRYKMEMKTEETAATLKTIKKDRQDMNWKNGLVFELVTIKMYVPEDFDLAGEQLIRKIASEEEINNRPDAKPRPDSEKTIPTETKEDNEKKKKKEEE